MRVSSRAKLFRVLVLFSPTTEKTRSASEFEWGSTKTNLAIRVGFKCQRCCVWKIETPRPALRCFWLVHIVWCLPWLVRFRHKGLMDWSGIGYLGQSIRVTRSREDQSLFYYEKNKYRVLNGEISVRNVKCGVWCENGSNCVTVTLKAWRLAAL